MPCYRLLCFEHWKNCIAPLNGIRYGSKIWLYAGCMAFQTYAGLTWYYNTCVINVLMKQFFTEWLMKQFIILVELLLIRSWKCYRSFRPKLVRPIPDRPMSVLPLALRSMSVRPRSVRPSLPEVSSPELSSPDVSCQFTRCQFARCPFTWCQFARCQFTLCQFARTESSKKDVF